MMEIDGFLETILKYAVKFYQESNRRTGRTGPILIERRMGGKTKKKESVELIYVWIIGVRLANNNAFYYWARQHKIFHLHTGAVYFSLRERKQKESLLSNTMHFTHTLQCMYICACMCVY